MTPGNPVPFALKYTLGNILSLGASSFLVGPARQCRTMFAKERRAASLAYLLTLAGSLLSLLKGKGWVDNLAAGARGLLRLDGT